MLTLITAHSITSGSSLAEFEDFVATNLLSSQLITSIHVLSDKISDQDYTYLSNKYNQLCISKAVEKPSLGDIITYAHSQIIESKYIAIVNTNIYLKTSTDLFEQLDSIASRFTNLGLTLTRRHDIITTQLSTVDSVIPDLSSSDGWIFKTKNFQETKINTSSFEDIAFGAKNSQNIIRIAFEQNGYMFANSCNLFKFYWVQGI